MQLGILYRGDPTARPGQFAQHVENLGFDSVWVGDHVLGSFDGLTAAALFGAATDRLLIGNSVLVLALRNPVMTARSLATLALEIPDRYVLGIGAGGDVPEEFDSVGVPLAGRGSRMMSHLEVLTRALDEGVVGSHSFDDRPTAGRPPVWLGGRNERAARRAGRYADGWMPYLTTPEQFAGLRQITEESRSEAGRVGESFTWAVNVVVAVAESRDEAWRDLRTARPFGLDDARLERFAIAGTTDDVLHGLKRFEEAGVEHVIADVVGTHRTTRPTPGQLELLAEVLPRLGGAHPF